MEACDKEIKKLFEMGTFSIVDETDIPPGHKSINCCMSFKIKKDGDGNILEYRTRCNADGRQQEVGSYGNTFAPTSKFSCIRSICAIAAQKGLTGPVSSKLLVMLVTSHGGPNHTYHGSAYSVRAFLPPYLQDKEAVPPGILAAVFLTAEQRRSVASPSRSLFSPPNLSSSVL